MSGNAITSKSESTINDSTIAQENNDGPRKRVRNADQNPLINGFHQGLMAHAWTGVSSQAWAGLKRNKRFNVGSKFDETKGASSDCAKENNEAPSAEISKATAGPTRLSRNPISSQETRNDPIPSHQPPWMQNQRRVPSQQPSASGSFNMFDTASSRSHRGLQDLQGSSSSAFSRTSQPLRNETRSAMGSSHLQGKSNRHQQQQGSSGMPNHYATGPVSLVNNALAFSLTASDIMSLAPSVDTPTWEGSGSCFSKLKSQVKSVSELISQHETFCSSAEFQAFVSCSGLKQPCFKRNPRLDHSNFEKFTKAWNNLAPDSKLSIVFHGTSKHNVTKILEYGLDPKRRSGQAYGPGEYFSNNPGISVSYCNGGNDMLVFAVVVPRTRLYNCPPDYVVVANNNHQLPLGSVTFEGVENQVLTHSSRMRAQLTYLSQIADRKALEANDAMHKAEIIQLLIGKKVDIASEKYQNYLVDLSDTSKREIAMYVHRLVDKALFAFYFPELPEPMKTQERDVAAILSVEETERDAKAAKDAFEKAKKKVPIPSGDNL